MEDRLRAINRKFIRGNYHVLEEFLDDMDSVITDTFKTCSHETSILVANDFVSIIEDWRGPEGTTKDRIIQSINQLDESLASVSNYTPTQRQRLLSIALRARIQLQLRFGLEKGFDHVVDAFGDSMEL